MIWNVNFSFSVKDKSSFKIKITILVLVLNLNKNNIRIILQNRSKLPLEILPPDAIATKSIESISFSMPKILINVKYKYVDKR